MTEKSFYDYVLSHRGGDWSDQKTRFAEAVYEDSAFPKRSVDFDELSRYIEMQAHEYMTTHVFDDLWSLYCEKYSISDTHLW